LLKDRPSSYRRNDLCSPGQCCTDAEYHRAAIKAESKTISISSGASVRLVRFLEEIQVGIFKTRRAILRLVISYFAPAMIRGDSTNQREALSSSYRTAVLNHQSISPANASRVAKTILDHSIKTKSWPTEQFDGRHGLSDLGDGLSSESRAWVRRAQLAPLASRQRRVDVPNEYAQGSTAPSRFWH
jgi:hypothetical protein